jgi:hypothetical protein
MLRGIDRQQKSRDEICDAVVLDIIGKSATNVAQIIRDNLVLFTKMMIGGAMATIGVTCNNTTYGNMPISAKRLCTKRKEANVTTITASRKASIAISAVLRSELNNNGRFSRKLLAAIELGAGNK